jgi:hypothetical protein
LPEGLEKLNVSGCNQITITVIKDLHPHLEVIR